MAQSRYGNNRYGNNRSNGSSYRSGNNYRSGNSYRSSGPEYPLNVNMFGVLGGVFITSNPDYNEYNAKKNYVDYGGGLIYDYRCEFSENAAFELITSPMLASCKTSYTQEGESKMKVTLPMDLRFYLGFSQLKLYLGGGLQYNFIWSTRDVDNGYSYGNRRNYNSYSSTESETSANQLSGNANVGLCVLGLQSRIHFLLGTKFHFPIINHAEGTEYSQTGSRIDFSKDKTSVVATGGFCFELSPKKSVLMVNYDYPLGNSQQTTVETGNSRNFFESHSQSITMSLMFVL